MTDTDWQPVRPGYCCLCNQRPLPRAQTEEQATAVLLAWTTLGIHPSNHAARWTVLSRLAPFAAARTS
jgi:hypothetical protein